MVIINAHLSSWSIKQYPYLIHKDVDVKYTERILHEIDSMCKKTDETKHLCQKLMKIGFKWMATVFTTSENSFLNIMVFH